MKRIIAVWLVLMMSVNVLGTLAGDPGSKADALTNTPSKAISVKVKESNLFSSLEDDLVLDFSETQFSFIDPMECWFIFKFKATNTGTKNLLLHFSQYCEESPGHVPIGAPQGETPLAPGESMWFKILPGGDSCGYDPNIPQTINRTLHMEFVDHSLNYAPENSSFSLNKTTQIKVINRITLEGDVIIQGITVDEEGKSVPYVGIELGGYGAKIPIGSNATGHFSYSIAESPVYFLIAQKEGYRTTTVEINGSNVQDFYTVTLNHEPSPISVNASLINSVSGNIGFWRCAATADESKLLLVNGMENWENESLKNQSKLYLLDTNTGETIWTHDMGWESWSADISDDSRYVVFGTKLEEFQTVPEGFVNYIRLVNGTNGSAIWEKKITPENFTDTTEGVHCSRGVKFSHNNEYIFVPVDREYGYLLNRLDGSIKWHKWVGANIREVIFTQDDQYVYIPSGNGWLYKLRVEDGSQVWKQWIGCWAYVNGFDISSDEEYIAVGSKAAYLTVINTSDGSVKFTKDIHGGTTTCRFSPDGTKLVSGGDLLTMFDLDGNVLWRYYNLAGDIRFSGDGSLIFITNGGVFDAYGTMLYDILPGWDRSTHVGWINSNATRYIFAAQDTRTTEEINIIEVYSIETGKDTTPTAVVLGTPTEITTNSILLSWSQNTDEDFANYTIYQSTTDGVTGNPIHVITDNATTSYNVTGLSPSTTYYFTVRVYDTGHLYNDSNQVSGTTLTENQPPTAYIDSILPSPAIQGQTVTFTGHGDDLDGSIVAYNWRSSIDGQLNTSASFSLSTLSVGTHTIYLKVQDNNGTWSSEVSSTLVINPPIQPTLTVTVNANPITVNSSGASTITITVTNGTTPISGATINLISNNSGSFSSVTDNGNGTYTAIFTAPSVTTQIICRITATASKTGYNSGSGYVDVTVNQIIGLSVALNSPIGGEIWTGGATHNINYAIGGGTPPYTVHINYTVGSETFNIATETNVAEGLHSCSWTLPIINSGAVTVKVNAIDSLGATKSHVSSQFTIDSTKPGIITGSIIPGNNTIALLTQPIIIQFTEPMNTASAENAFSITPDPGGWLWTWNDAKDTMTGTHASFTSGITYTCTISATAKDVSAPGNLLNASYQWSFIAVAGRGDLTVVVEYPSSPEIGKNYIITVKIYNTGSKAFNMSGSLTVTFYINNVVIDTKNVQPIQKDAYVEVSSESFSFDNVGASYIMVRFSSTNTVDIIQGLPQPYEEVCAVDVVQPIGTRYVTAIINGKEVNITGVWTGTINVTSVALPPTTPENLNNMGIFIAVNLTGAIEYANITIRYNESNVVGIDESRLRMYYWNESEGKWKLCENTGVDTANNIVWANVTHLTIFAPMAERVSVNQPPAAVVLNLLTSITANSMQLSWSQNTDSDFAKYEMYQSTSSGTLGSLVTTITTQPTTSYTVTGLSAGTTYYFTIRVVDNGALYTDSNQISAATQNVAPPPKGFIPGFETFLLLIVLTGCGAIGIRRRKKASPPPQSP